MTARRRFRYATPNTASDRRLPSLRTIFDQFITQRYRALVVLLLLANLALSVTSIRDKALTYDEPYYIGLGTFMLRTGDTTGLVPCPPFAFYVNSLFWNFLEFDPVLWQHFQKVHPHMGASPGLKLIFESGHDPDLLTFLARLPVILTFPLLGLMVFAWSRELWGVKAGLFSLVLAAFSPNLLAHARLAATDFLTALTVFAGIFFFRRYLKAPAWSRLIPCGVALGLALLTKFTAFILLPSYVLLAILLPRDEDAADRTVARPFHYVLSSRLLHKPAGQLRVVYGMAFISAVAALVIWSAYLFQVRPLYVPPHRTDPPEEYFSGIPKFLYDKATPLPAASYWVAFYDQSHHMKAGHQNYFMGRITHEGRWYYFPFALLIKLPIPTLIFLCICLTFSLRAQYRKKGGKKPSWFSLRQS